MLFLFTECFWINIYWSPFIFVCLLLCQYSIPPNILILFYSNFFMFCKKERLIQMQVHLGHPQLKLIQEVETCWNSTYVQTTGASALQTDVLPTDSRWVSEERQVSASKTIPLLKMLDHALAEQALTKTVVRQLTDVLYNQVREKLQPFQTMSILTMLPCWTQDLKPLASSVRQGQMKLSGDSPLRQHKWFQERHHHQHSQLRLVKLRDPQPPRVLSPCFMQCWHLVITFDDPFVLFPQDCGAI